jgi:lysophospholipase L1-like esterase
MRRPLLRLAFVLATATAAALFATPAQAATAVDYVALGDSYSSGVGSTGATGSCLQSPNAYAPLWVNGHAVTSFRFVACSGATTSDVLANQVSSLDAGTDLATITIGGNDVGFADVVTTCQFQSTTDCSNAIAQSEAIATNTLPGLLDNTYATIRGRAPNARVVVLGYPRLFELTTTCGLLGMNLTKRTMLNKAADDLAGVIAGRVIAAGFTWVDVRAVFSGHGICGSSPWINNVNLLDPVRSFHPNNSGYASGYLPSLTSVTG